MPADHDAAASWQPEPVWNDVGVAPRYKNFWRRSLAGLIDGLLFVPLAIFDEAISRSSVAAVLLIWGAISYFSFETYSVLMHAKFGATVGKMATGLVVLDVSEARVPGLKQAFMRELPWVLTVIGSYLYLVMLVLDGRYAPGAELHGPGGLIELGASVWLLLELITMLASEKRRALHDLIGRTVVVRRKMVVG